MVVIPVEARAVAYPSRVIIELDRILSRIDGSGSEQFLRIYGHTWLLGRTRNRFYNEGDEVSGKWKPLAQSTIEFRENQGFPSYPINRRTGEMERLLTDGAGIPDVKAWGPVLGTILLFPGYSGMKGYLKKKVATAQHGSKNKPVTPARPVLGLGLKDYAFIMGALKRHVEE